MVIGLLNKLSKAEKIIDIKISPSNILTTAKLIKDEFAITLDNISTENNEINKIKKLYMMSFLTSLVIYYTPNSEI